MKKEVYSGGSLSKEVIYVYGVEGLLAEYDGSGNLMKKYVWNPDRPWGTDPLWMEDGSGNRYYYINDHLFTPQKMIDTSGNTVWDADWDSFGTLTITINTVENNLRFPGQYYDSETGFYYNFHRYYMPEVGRYLREDPAGGSGNYFYVNSNPVSFMDYLGLIPSNSDFHCWIVCDWAFSFVGEFTNLFHCWLEWGNKVPTAAPRVKWGIMHEECIHLMFLEYQFHFYRF